MMEKIVSSFSKLHVQNLKNQPQTLCKTADLSMDEFPRRICALADFLAISCEALKKTEDIDHVLGGLRTECSNFVNCDQYYVQRSTTFDEAYILLITEDL